VAPRSECNQGVVLKISVLPVTDVSHESAGLPPVGHRGLPSHGSQFDELCDKLFGVTAASAAPKFRQDTAEWRII
jgi:hypothetical protein